MALTTIFEEVERSIYESIRLVAVAEGLTPDVLNYTNDETSYNLYKQALTTIKAQKGFAVEVFNNSQPEQKGMIETSRISIAHGGTMMGDIGLPVQKDWDNTGTSSTMVLGTTMTNEYNYQVYLTARNLKEFRIIQGILLTALPSRSWIDFIVGPDRFLNIMTAGYPSPSELRGVKEFTYSYSIPDLLITPYVNGPVVTNMDQLDVDLLTYLGIN